MVDLYQAHQHNTDVATEQTTYQKKYKFVHSELLSCQQVLGGSPNEMNCLEPYGDTNSMLAMIMQTFQAAPDTVD